MTRTELQNLLSRLEYHDWEFRLSFGHVIEIGPPGRVVEQAYPDRDWPQKFFERIYVDEYMDEATILRLIRAHIAALMDHEVFEWFKKDGKAALDPHYGPRYAQYGNRRSWFVEAERGAL